MSQSAVTTSGSNVEVDDKPTLDSVLAAPLAALGDGVVPVFRFNPMTGKFEAVPFNFKVSPTSPPSMQVQINDGTALIKGQIIGTTKIVEGKIVGVVPISPADPTLPRKDLVVIKSSIDERGQVRQRAEARQTDFEVIPGTPSATPVVAKTDAQLNEEGKVRLAVVTVPPGATSIVAENIGGAPSFADLLIMLGELAPDRDSFNIFLDGRSLRYRRDVNGMTSAFEDPQTGKRVVERRTLGQATTEYEVLLAPVKHRFFDVHDKCLGYAVGC